jgi:hypothetical protein
LSKDPELCPNCGADIDPNEEYIPGERYRWTCGSSRDGEVLLQSEMCSERQRRKRATLDDVVVDPPRKRKKR